MVEYSTKHFHISTRFLSFFFFFSVLDFFLYPWLFSLSTLLTTQRRSQNYFTGNIKKTSSNSYFYSLTVARAEGFWSHNTSPAKCLPTFFYERWRKTLIFGGCCRYSGGDLFLFLNWEVVKLQIVMFRTAFCQDIFNIWSTF